MDHGHVYFWFRRDLRIHDNHGLYKALNSGKKAIPVFIFDRDILGKLSRKNDARVGFIHRQVQDLHQRLLSLGSGFVVLHGTVEEAWKEIFNTYGIADIYTNRDYEPYARKRDSEISEFCRQSGVHFYDFKDQVIFDTTEILKNDGLPYTVFTPYSKKWHAALEPDMLKPFDSESSRSAFLNYQAPPFPDLESLGFVRNPISVPPQVLNRDLISAYAENRDFPSRNGTSRLSVHLRFGTVSIRELATAASELSDKWLNELIWREFYMQILWHFPHVTENCFDRRYDRIPWINDAENFEKWCEGKTGYPIVDAGMRELNQTGYMHNRVRMIVASFLTKHLMVDWRWGEAYFAEKLLDFELSSNNGGWQWAAGCGVDAAPYFRIFNPELQTRKFDPEYKYIRQWVPEFGTPDYAGPVIEHTFARQRCLQIYKAALSPLG